MSRPICPFPLFPSLVSIGSNFFISRNSKKSSALVGYAAIDGDATWIVPLASYLGCDPSGGNSGSTAIDLFGLND
jgi:hypothetical protein